VCTYSLITYIYLRFPLAFCLFLLSEVALTVTLRHDTNTDDDHTKLMFVFTCKTHPEHHKPHYRPCKKTSEGTSNLQGGITQCHLESGDVTGGSKPKVGAIPYSEAAHCTLIALHCAKNHQPFILHWMKITKLRWTCYSLAQSSPTPLQLAVTSKQYISRCQNIFGNTYWSLTAITVYYLIISLLSIHLLGSQ
jgi:hypothetical protein